MSDSGRTIGEKLQDVDPTYWKKQAREAQIHLNAALAREKLLRGLLARLVEASEAFTDAAYLGIVAGTIGPACAGRVVILADVVAEARKEVQPSPSLYFQVLDCGCTVAKGYRCPVHNDP